MEKNIKVLHCINGIGSGGAETDIINWFSVLHKSKITFDFLIRSNDLFYEDEIKQMGGEVFVTSSNFKKILKNYMETKRFIKENAYKYNAIHVHGNSMIYILPLIFAKKYEIPVRIFHVHSTKAGGFISNIIHNYNKKVIKKYANIFIACSCESAKFAMLDSPVIIKNMIDFSKFKKHEVEVKMLAAKYKMNQCYTTYANIGRLLPVKNQKFVIEVFYEIRKVNPNSQLLLIGVGPLETELRNLVQNLDLNESVYFLGQVNDVCDLLQIIDLVIFPSLYEGIPLTLIEAQASETKVLCADTVDEETKITPYLEFLSLNESQSCWAKSCIELLNMPIECDVENAFEKADYNLEREVEKLKKIYTEKCSFY